MWFSSNQWKLMFTNILVATYIAQMNINFRRSIQQRNLRKLACNKYWYNHNIYIFLNSKYGTNFKILSTKFFFFIIQESSLLTWLSEPTRPIEQEDDNILDRLRAEIKQGINLRKTAPPSAWSQYYVQAAAWFIDRLMLVKYYNSMLI